MRAGELRDATVLCEFERRRRELGLSRSALARRSRVSLPTVNRILTGQYGKASFENVLAVARALELELTAVESNNSDTVRTMQARKHARRLLKLLQGTSALEGQAVEQQALDTMLDRTASQLLESNRRLWGDE